MKSDFIDIEVINWEKHNQRKSKKNNYPWFKFSTNFFFDDKISVLNASEKCLYVYVLCLCSAKNASFVHVSYKLATRFTRLRTSFIHNAIEKFQQIGLVNVFGNQILASQNKNREEKKRERVEDEKKISSSDEELSPNKFGPSDLFDLWNLQVGIGIPKVRLPTSNKRTALAKARLKELPNKQDWETVVDKINKSPFLTGNNKSNWVANIDFVLRPGSPEKILDGNYDDKSDRAIFEALLIEAANEAIENDKKKKAMEANGSISN